MAEPTLPSLSSRPSRRRAFRAASLLVLTGTLGFWAARGAHTGWSQNRVPVAQTDEVTGIEYVTYEERFVPGVDVLAGSVAGSAALFTLSLLYRSKPHHHPPHE